MKLLRTLRVKFAIAVTLVVLVVLGLNLLITLSRTNSMERATTIRDAKATSQLATQVLVDAYLKNKDTVGLRLTNSIRPLANQLTAIEYFQIIDTKSNVTYDSRTLKRSVPAETITDTQLLKALGSGQSGEVITPQAHWLVHPYTADDGSRTHSVAYRVSYAGVATALRTLVLQTLALMVVFGVASFFFMTWLLHKFIVSPIESLRADTNAITGGTYSHRIKTKSHDEVSQLAQNINTMADNLTQRIEKLEEEKAWKDEFIVLASHNLRTPLTVMMSSANSLKKEKLSPEGTKFLNFILSRGKELHALIENLLSISLLKGDKIQAAKEPFDLMKIVNTIVEDQQIRVKERKLELTVKSKSETLIVNGSEGQLFQVIDNLVDNAIKFTPEGGTVEVIVDDAKYDVRVTVKDNGKGIEQKMVNKLFQSFRRGSEPLSVEHRGSGLGLYFVKLAIEAHGGEVAIKSEQGKGTEVSFHIPKGTS